MGVVGNPWGISRSDIVCLEGNGTRPNIICFEPGIASRDGGHIYVNVSGTLRSNPGDNQMTIVCIEGNGSHPANKGDGYHDWG